MIDYATITKTGEKPSNEDAVRVFINQPLATYGFVLADGLGGHGNGDIASNFVADCIGAAIENTDNVEGKFIDECFQVAQDMLMEEKSLKGYPSIKTTMVFLLITNKFARWGHIGDSRIYHFHNGKQVSRTIDHSVPQMLALSGQISESDIRHHPDRSVLLRAMGAEWPAPAYEIDQRDMLVQKGDSFLLCSDGFWEWIEEKTITKILKSDVSAYDMLAMMEEEVLANGQGKGMDNYSAILANVK
ncbi:MAG: serine/threonine-protein phosphatase [Lachnospiraceae bacterium]|nr:serine/threonine-protein phosphatase [Lachnospiraceae bacterium]